ncbi:MAG TPA: MBOAT family O-acyltransferase [Salinimicrobium sp.]|nr:MBOAT family O-acyltransferase [Salinimicrobium sp.]
MLFNSWLYIAFLVVVVLVYWFFLSNKKYYRNIFLLLISYFFYGCWDWRFLGLIFLSSLIDYFVSLKIFENAGNKKVWLILSLACNLGLLFVFKYFNFFIESWVDLMNSVGFQTDYYSLSLILPVGISFYTFQTLSYTIDVYRGVLKPVKSSVAFFAYVSFFPQLVAGPIERACNLLPQFEKIKSFNPVPFASGVKLIIWGLFKKMVIADYCAIYVNHIFSNYTQASSSELLLGAVFFGFQIYGDFSGYTDIAIGSARLLGFDLMKNFRTPYFATTLADFWRRWHISLTTWFRDYLYIPLGGSRGGLKKTIRNVWIIFLVSGFWHGANWTFIIWGGIHALFFMPYLLKWNENSFFKKFPAILGTLFTFAIVSLAWVFFRAPSVSVAYDYLKGIFVNENSGIFDQILWVPSLLIILFLILEKTIKDSEVPSIFKFESVVFRRVFIVVTIGCILFFSLITTQNEFIYFQF